MVIRAFISCRFPVDPVVTNICEMLQPDIVPYVSNDVKLGSLPARLREKIAASDCLVAILTEKGSSAFVQNEVGIAYALNKPVFAIYEDNVDVGGIQPYLSTFIRYKQGAEARIAHDILGLKSAALTEIAAREVAGAPEEILENLNKNGVLNIYPDRATAFRRFAPVWQREKEIRIVASSMEGFKRGIGIEARELILPKLQNDPAASIHILLTHVTFCKYRESQERELNGYICAQIKATVEMLAEVKELSKAGERLKWKFFKGAPTCFMIMAGSMMLLNPYLYMQPAYFNFTMLVRDTHSSFDIYNHYRKNHFQGAWEHPELSTEDSGLPPVDAEDSRARG